MSIGDLIKQKTYERIAYFLHRNFVTFIPIIFLFIILLIAPTVVGYLLRSFFLPWWENPLYQPLMILFASAYLLSVALFFFSYFVAFYLDVWIITNDRLVDIRQVSLFSRTIAEVDLYQIQDATSEVKGFWASIFNYGNIHLQTAGPVPRFILYNVTNPNHLREKILDLSAEDKKFHNK
ncbi:MAG: PH domain-containing protein [Candidatus Magasanikbacteria bacterium]